ncbi:PRMT5 arginine-N-methyltransferase-domain-containing protein [Infundibulicybe gibba]|nr:PRMT5 arginine-N-methyltransferase-domain-containing protein [Infundibulicybe gibba]
MASWDPSAAISTYLTLEDISNAPRDSKYATPVLKLTADAQDKGYDIVCLPITTDKWKQRWTDMCVLPPGSDGERHGEAEQRAEAWRSRPGFMRDEVTITRVDEGEGVTAMISDWLELDAVDDWVRHDTEIALQQELSYISYLNIQTAILPPPQNRNHVASYARIVNSCLKNTPYIHLSIRLPIYNPSIFHPSPSNAAPRTPPRAGTSPHAPRLMIPDRDVPAPEAEVNATWEMWDVIRSMCDYNPRLTLTLDLSPALPTKLGVLSKWTAESVRYIFLPSSTFIANTKGYPVLPKPTQNFLRDSMIHRPTIILAEAHLGNHTRGGEAAYSQYIKHMERSSSAVQAAHRVGAVENFAMGYQDYLQAPLQPLMDNLQSVTYQTFEQDPVKYRHYEEAIYRALVEWPSQEEEIVLCVAGAGRGPLVARSLAAIQRSGRSACVYAVEKNPNAFVTLQNRHGLEWDSKVKLLFGDMRSIEVPEKADILISELLGSFGDNELSPECLDGAMRFLKSNGISIPSSYTAHLAPLSSSKLYNEARTTKDEKSVETPYVVMFQAVNILSGDGGGISGSCGPQVQECWEFEHPRRDPVLDNRGLPLTNSHNARSAKLNFHIPHAGVLHGLAGYFEAVLYDNIGLSIHPHHKDHVSKDMLSWFPLFFPFREPLYLPSNSELQVSIWRLTNERQVWYEWHAESFLVTLNTSHGDAISGSPGNSAAFNSTSPSVGNYSPLVDAFDSAVLDQRQGAKTPPVLGTVSIVKIGQTSLHNPGGRSSWIGL